LGQERSIRRRAVAALIAERQRGIFTDLDDLCRRVELQRKELTHLIQCGALDGLGASRAALLADVKASGTARLQLAFAFDKPMVDPEHAAERLQWERQVLGQPVSVHPLATVEMRPPSARALQQAVAQPGKPIQIAATRLPGWTGGKGYFVDDGEQFVVAIAQEKVAKPTTWAPLLLTGRWLVDEWGGGWFQVEDWQGID